MKRLHVLALGFALALAAPALADELDQPQFKLGDEWVYDTVDTVNGAAHEVETEITVSRLQGDRMLLAVKPVDSTKPPIEHLAPLDWSRPRSVNGVETIVNRPMAFPLAVGKTWRVEYTELNPNLQHVREQFEIVFKVVGRETVKTPAGEFKTLKIEANGNWIADTAPKFVSNSVVAKGANGAAARVDKNIIPARRATGRIYKVFYYAPAVKRWAKSLEEYYNANGDVTSAYTEELKAFHAGGD